MRVTCKTKHRADAAVMAHDLTLDLPLTTHKKGQSL